MDFVEQQEQARQQTKRFILYFVLAIRGRNGPSVLRIDAALEHLAQASPQLKKLVLNACAHAVASDGVLQSREAELLRAIADTLDCPLPPFLEAAPT